jgi:uncharacterized membrane protein YhaH (DUF805 family)
MTSNSSPDTSRTIWWVLLVVAVLIGGAAIVLIALDPTQTGMYFTLVGMLCLIFTSLANLRRPQ